MLAAIWGATSSHVGIFASHAGWVNVGVVWINLNFFLQSKIFTFSSLKTDITNLYIVNGHRNLDFFALILKEVSYFNLPLCDRRCGRFVFVTDLNVHEVCGYLVLQSAE